MIKTKKIKVKDEVVESVECDVCHKIYFSKDFSKDIEDQMQIQEFRYIRFTGGYGSIFGDEVTVECDICQHCFNRLVGKYCRIK